MTVKEYIESLDPWLKNDSYTHNFEWWGHGSTTWEMYVNEKL